MRNNPSLSAWRTTGPLRSPACGKRGDRRQAPPLLTCCILTTAANELVRPVHDRMPVILDPRHYAMWIDRTVQEPAAPAPLLRPFDADRMRAYPVSQWVNDARHEDARCLEL